MGVRGLLPYKQFAAHMPKVEFELTGCIPLFDGSMEHVKSTAFRNLPNGPNANFNGQTLTLRGLVPRLTKIYTSLSIRVIDARPVKRLIGTGEQQVFLRRDELAFLEKKGSNLVSVKRKETTPDEREKLLEILRDETISITRSTSTIWYCDTRFAIKHGNGMRPRITSPQLEKKFYKNV